ncbi:MAG: tyrosine-type recombinase/integrase [Cyanobacteria bacterium P01_A01_bin.123]
MAKVSVVGCNGSLRLEWRVRKGEKKRYLSPGLRDTPLNRQIALQRAIAIENDLVTGNYDPTLAKYKSHAEGFNGDPLVKVFERFMQYKRSRDLIRDRTLEKYDAVLANLKRYFGQRSITEIEEKDAVKFRDWLLGNVSKGTAKTYITLTGSCLTWAIKQQIVLANPFLDLSKSIKVPSRQVEQPYTPEEIQLILAQFEQSRHYCFYTDYVAFLFDTGVRLEEAAGLKWGHVSRNCSTVWIGEVATRGVTKETKTGKARSIRLGEGLKQRLNTRRDRAQFTKKGDLVFPAKKGGAIRDDTFRKVWQKNLEALGIDYRRPYCSRHTWASYALNKISPAEVAQMMGDNPQTVFKNYAGAIRTNAIAPSLIDFEEESS